MKQRKLSALQQADAILVLTKLIERAKTLRTAIVADLPVDTIPKYIGEMEVDLVWLKQVTSKLGIGLKPIVRKMFCAEYEPKP